jgi:hypothetical protein
MIEEAEYVVRASLTTTITFSPIERPTPITQQDAIANAMGTMPDSLWHDLEDEGWTVEFTAERL